ncbi:transcription factor with AP2 domain(s), putative [Plasmodium gallinaceum]|uniref:Transcription factor with AP2 domain(S), putative n=1 Tax=Plasmodium gallinaceum TaxID=5849 RepID=A0A1J1GXY2_PLAGA|nr:transcription factor with AP2 domain(s), putative [Plasmodium gallinaceum]CRG96136.1 transcription factor with AP2 domain(s), putative [Plasmodium gallinaceum]
MLELRTSSNTNKKSSKLDEKSKKVIKSENDNSEDLKKLYNEDSINKMDNYMNYSEQKTQNYPISRTTTSNVINGGSMESVNDGTFNNNSKCANISNDYENIKQINENIHMNSEHREGDDYENLNDKNKKIIKNKNNEDHEEVGFESPKIELELNEKEHGNENDIENENEKMEESQNEKMCSNKSDLNYKIEDKNGIIKEETSLLYDMENIYKKNDFPPDFNENNLSDSNNNINVNSSNTLLDKACEDEESKEKYDENFISYNSPCGYKEEIKKENPLFKGENEIENNMNKLNEDMNLIDENNVNLKNSLIKELITKKNSKEIGNDQNKTLSLIDNLLNLKNDERLNNQLNKYLNEEKNNLEINKKSKDTMLENGSCDNFNCIVDTGNNESTNKNENLMKLKIICLSYLRILKRLTSLWSETDKTFEYHFVNLLNNVNSNNLDNYLCCFSNIKICFIKNVFLDSIIECIEELEIIKKFKMSEKKEDINEKGVMDKNEFHKQILEEVENNLTKEIIEEIFQLTLKNPYCNNNYLNNMNTSEGEHNTLSIFSGSSKNNLYNGSNLIFDLKKGKDYLNCSNRNICNSLGNCTANQSNHTCNSHTNHSCGNMSLNYSNSFPFNCINSNIGNSTNNINNKNNIINNSSTNGNNTNYNNYSIGSSGCKKKCNYSDENILNKLNVSIDYNSYNDFNNNYIQEAEKVVEKYKNLSKINSKDSENMYSSCSHTNMQDINNNNLNAYLQLKMFISEYENLCKNDKIKLKDLDLNANDLNFLKCLYAHLNSTNILEDKGISDMYNAENDSKESKKNYYENKLKLECSSNNDLNKLIPNYKLNEEESFEDRENYSKYERDQGLLNSNDNLNYLSNSFQNILRKRKIYDNYLSKCNNGSNMNNNSCYDLNYLLYNTNVLKKLKFNLLENKKNGHNDFRKKDSNDLTLDDSSSHVNSRKSYVYKNNILNNLKNFKDMLNLSQESINKKGSFKNSADHINPSTLYDFILNTNSSSNVRENSLQHNTIANNISSNNSSVNNSNNNNSNGININSNYNINNNSIQKKNSYDYNPDYNSKISANGSELSINNQENNDGILNNGKVESSVNYKSKNDINKNIAMNNKNTKNVKNASGSPVSTNYGIGKLKYEMPVGVNPNDDKVKGVYFSKSPRGVGKWNAYFQIANNKRLFTSFSVSKYGYNEARKLSILKRTEWEKEYKHHTDLKNSDSKKGKKKSHVAASNLLRSNVKNISKGNSNNSNSDASISYAKDNQLKEDCLLYSNDEEGLISNKINTDIPSDINDQQSSNKKINKLNMGNNGYIKVEDNLNFFIECAKNENESFNSVDLLRSSLTNDKNNSKKNSMNYTQNSITNPYNNVIDNKHPLNSSRILSNSLGLSNKYIRNLHFPTIDSHAVSNFLEAVTDDQKISS